MDRILLISVLILIGIGIILIILAFIQLREMDKLEKEAKAILFDALKSHYLNEKLRKSLEHEDI